MKAATAKLLRAVIRLVEDDVRELADTVVEIDEREAAHYAYLRGEIEALRATVNDDRRYIAEVARDLEQHGMNYQHVHVLAADNHSRKPCYNPDCTITAPHVHKPEGVLYV